MKKSLFIFLSIFVVLLVWCTIDKNQIKEIDSQRWEKLFNNQMDDFQYIKDLEDFFSYDVLCLTENKPFTSDFSFTAKFDEKSLIQWWVDFSRDKSVKTQDLEFSDIKFDIKTEKNENSSEPFDLSWDVSLLYKDNEMYLNLHNLGVFMWEGNMVAKMYTLLWDLVINNWVDLEVRSGWIVVLDESWNKKLPYIAWTVKNILKTEDVQTSPNFLWSVVELFDLINSYIDLWISTNGLSLVNQEVSYFELSDWSIQKMFTWSFQWEKSVFDASFVVSKKWLEARLYNIGKYDENISDYEDTKKYFMFSLQENKKSEYLVKFESLDLQQKLVDLQGEIKYDDMVKFSADFVLEPLEIEAWNKVSWKLDWSIIRRSWEWDKKVPEFTGNVLLRSDILALL